MLWTTSATFTGMRMGATAPEKQVLELVIETPLQFSPQTSAAFEALAWRALGKQRPDWVPANHVGGALFLPAMGIWLVNPIVTLSHAYLLQPVVQQECSGNDGACVVSRAKQVQPR